MSMAFTWNRSAVAGGKTFGETKSVSSDGQIVKEKSIAAAKNGTLTTRTDNDTGELTMAASHGITTGQRLDVYWSGGCRRGMTVGTVATNAVPIDGGSGDVLPSASTVITAMVPTEIACKCVGSNVTGIAVYSEAKGIFVFADASDVELAAYVSTEVACSNGWVAGHGDASPLAGDTVDSCFVSHGDSTAAKVMRFALAIDG